ncbi:unnamed protein product [Toxocara canis]|uniref:Ground-like domain-containing protein n=1 Tax=Toxocara canis TaxID=6265 RepID=A0A183UPE0_TOXCA|nr:unnamed protein product [Toxocara canis]
MQNWFAAVLLLSVAAQAVSGCGCCTPCIPLPPPCPPPIICPPAICPPPAPCPPPIIPVPCPPPPPCIPPPIIIQNVCCVTCVTPCVMRARRRRDISAQNFTTALSVIVDDSVCNNLKLKTIMEENMKDKDPRTAMMNVRKAIEKKLPGKYTVICAKDDLSYAAYTDSFCQTRKDPLTCYAFKPLMATALFSSAA